MTIEDLATYNARQIAAKTGISEKKIRAGWDDGSIPYILKGRGQKKPHKVMTEPQIRKMQQDLTVQAPQPATPAPAPKPVDDITAGWVMGLGRRCCALVAVDRVPIVAERECPTTKRCHASCSAVLSQLGECL